MAVQDMSGKQKFDSFRSHVAWPCLLGDFFSMAFWGIGKPGNHLWVFHGFPQKSSRNSQYEPIMPIVGTLDSSFVMLEQLWQLVGIFCQPPWLRFWWFNPMSPMAIMWGSFYILPEWLQFCLNMTCWACGPPRNKLYDLWYIYIQICTSCTNTTYTFFLCIMIIVCISIMSFISSSWPAFVVSKTWGLQQECQADYPSLRLLQKVGFFTGGNLLVAFMNSLIDAFFSEIAVLLPHNLATCLPYTNDSTSHEGLYRKRDRNMGIAVLIRCNMNQFVAHHF